MKKIAALAAALVSIFGISLSAHAEYIDAYYLTNFSVYANGFAGNNLRNLKDGVAANDKCVFFNDTYPYSADKYFEAYLSKEANVQGIELWSFRGSGDWNFLNQSITEVTVKYYDGSTDEWNTIEEDCTLEYTAADANTYKAVVTFDEPVKTHRLRLYISGRVGVESSPAARIDEFKIFGTATDTAWTNGNVLYNATITSSDNYWGIIEKIADGKTDEGSDHSNIDGEYALATPEKPYEIFLDLDDYYSVDSFDMLYGLTLQGVTQMKLEYLLADNWIEIDEYTYDCTSSNAATHGNNINAMLINESFDKAVVSNKFKLTLTGCQANNTFRITELIFNGEKAKEYEIPAVLADLSSSINGDYVKFEGQAPFVVKAVTFAGAPAGAAEIGYFENDQFVSLKTVELVEGNNFVFTDFEDAKTNIAVKVNGTIDVSGVKVYGTDPYGALAADIAALATSKSYSEYEAITAEINNISDSSVKAFMQDKLDTVVAAIKEAQELTVSDFDGPSRSFKLSGTVFAANDSDVSIAITDPDGVVQNETIKVSEGKIDSTVTVSSAVNGEYTVSTAVFGKQLSGKITVRQVLAGNSVLTFTVDGVSGVINGNTITLVLPQGSTTSQRIAVFTVSEGAKLYLNGTLIESGITAIDYSANTQIKAVAENGAENTYTVIMTVAASVSTGGGGGGGRVKTNKTNAIITVPKEDVINANADSAFEFSDVAKEHWAYNAIMTLYANNVVSGVDSENYAPDREVKREEFVTMLSRAMKMKIADEESSFVDAAENWSSKYVAAMHKAGYVYGVSEDNFGIGMGMTREDVCTIILRCLGEENTKAEAAVFDDEDMISDYALGAVKFMQSKGYIVGADNKFMPKKNISRAEAAQILATVFYK